MLEILFYEVNNLETSMVISGLPKSKEPEKIIDKFDDLDGAYKRTLRLGNAPSGSGHDCMLKGIDVIAIIKAPLYFWKQWDRYHFQDTISSSSTMHRILDQDLENVFPDNVYDSTLEQLKEDISTYRDNPDDRLFRQIVSNLPQGYLYTRGVRLNYLQAKTMYKQRNNHKLKEWHTFCDFLEDLPNSEIFLN